MYSKKEEKTNTLPFTVTGVPRDVMYLLFPPDVTFVAEYMQVSCNKW